LEVPTLLDGRLFLVRGFGVHRPGLPDAGPDDLLAGVGTPRRLIRRDLNRLARIGRFVQRLNDPDVLHALLARRLRRRVVEDAVREIEQLRRELIALADLLPFGLAVDRQGIPQTLCVFVGGIDVEPALGADNLERNETDVTPQA